MLGSIIGHVCQVDGSPLWVVQTCGNKALIFAVETSRYENLSINDSSSMPTQSQVQRLDKAVKQEKPGSHVQMDSCKENFFFFLSALNPIYHKMALLDIYVTLTKQFYQKSCEI